jgi:hypothetical protein
VSDPRASDRERWGDRFTFTHVHDLLQP